MVAHLSQIIAIEKDTKDKAAARLTQARNTLGNKSLLTGIARAYTPKDEDGEHLPPESTRVQQTVARTLKEVQESLNTLFDTVATKEYANCLAKADIVVGGQTLLKLVPATYILFLEKQLAELLAFVKTIPTLDPAEEWRYDTTQDCYAAAPSESIRSKKVMRNHVLAEATPHHPAQVQVYAEDVPAGRWKTVKYSGAMPAAELNAIIGRIETLQKAVKFAREAANRQEVVQQHVGHEILQYIFG